MLLRFRLANVRSLRDEQELSFVAPEDNEVERAAARETVLSDGRQLPVHTVLGVFGANASGKSDVVAALKDMRRVVLRSYTDWTSYDGIPRDEFALDPKAAADLALRLTSAEAEVLHAQLCYALDDTTASVITPASKLPDCRQSTLPIRRP